VLTHGLWNRLGADPAILGTQVRLNGQPYTVIGIMPSSFAFVRNASLGPPQRADAYTTFNVNLAETNPGAGSDAGLIRARRGTSPQTVAAAVDAAAPGVTRPARVPQSENPDLRHKPVTALGHGLDEIRS
jgi:hypothetical protein